MKKLILVKSCFLVILLLTGCTKETVYLVKEVVITFDDAPNFPENTGQILDVLEKHQAHATFFCIGESLRLYPELASRIASEQTMGNHTYTHLDIGKSDLSKIFESEIQKTQDLIDSLQPDNRRFFRPPYGSLTPNQKTFLARKGFDVVMWDLSAEEWNDNVTAQQVVNYFHKNLYTTTSVPVILFHLNKSTIVAVDSLLTEFEEKGISVIPLEDLRSP